VCLLVAFGVVCHWLHMLKSFNIMDFSKFQSFIASVWKAKHGSPSFLAVGCADGLHKGGEFHRAAGVVAVLPIGGIVAELVNGVCGSLKEGWALRTAGSFAKSSLPSASRTSTMYLERIGCSLGRV
jgi:hypothetical protein